MTTASHPFIFNLEPYTTPEGVHQLWTQRNQLLGNWPVGLCHEFAWICTNFVLQRLKDYDEEPRHGSWFALATKRQWLQGTLTESALLQSLQLARPTLMPENWSEEAAWTPQDRASLNVAVDTFQNALSLQERAWMEADVSMHLGKDAVARLLWGSVQPTPPKLVQILAWTEHAMRHLERSKAWKQVPHRTWEQDEQQVERDVLKLLHDVRLWLEDELADLCKAHQEQRKTLLEFLERMAQNAKQNEDRYTQSLEDSLFA
ncbi:MAG: hypothetical protein EP343_08795 [Deltaproteobacteria bacterium]|nr:MAG: hypothetical protein EP343_08795 [Deltaproteobacteria bacterium]